MLAGVSVAGEPVGGSTRDRLVAAEATDSRLTVRFFSTPWAEVETTSSAPYDIRPGEIRDGFTIEFGRTITYPDGSTRREDHVHTYQPQD